MPRREPTTATGRRSPGRPRRVIEPAAVADAAAALFAEGGYDAVSIEAVAEKLAVSRATLYRTVPTKEHLLGVLFERSTRDLYQAAIAVIEKTPDPGDRMFGLVHLGISAAVTMRNYMPVFFGGAGLPSDVYARWQDWTRRYESLWVVTVNRAIEAGVLPPADAMVTTRLLLGMCIWVSRWYRPDGTYSPEEITAAATRLLGKFACAPHAGARSQ
ncbi:TetR/AcrR family transcriptional regulator [Nocardia miyunensis]|uniref:TetR/AcrR family transcriptional regulator n=1 Tax=Nocardia miyunensis TaxID=282684 RepID=UPI0008368B15|nr:TetR/AcrR family transcriptional regulator [Nocardia miyunensis]